MRSLAASWARSVSWKGIAILLLSAAALGGSAVAQNPPSGPNDSIAASSVGPAADDDADGPFHPPFTQYPDDPGSLRFDDLSRAEQDGAMRMAERADYGPEVHGAWSVVTRNAAADAVARRAAYAAGINGIDEIGVK